MSPDRGKPATRRLTVYSRRDCHLCEEMISGLRRLQAAAAFELEVVDVDREPALVHRYGDDVPVLVHGGRELCRHHLDAAAVTAFLSEIR